MLAMVVSSLCFPMLGVVVRAVRQQDDVFTVMFFSGLLNCIALWTVLLIREKRRAFRTSIPHVHLLRGALGALGATSIVYSMKFVQVDLALTVLMSSPVWSALLGPVLAQRRIELGHLDGHWFGFLWNPDYRQSWCGRSKPLGTADLGSRSRDVIAKHDDDPLHRVG